MFFFKSQININNYIPTETLSPRVKQTITKLLSMVRFQQVVLFLVITAAFIPARLDVEILTGLAATI